MFKLESFRKFILALALSGLPFIGSGNPVTTPNKRDAAPPSTENVVELQRLAVKRSLIPRQTATLWENKWQTAYLGNITIDQTIFQLMVDTGSSHTWVTVSNLTCTHTDNCITKHLPLATNEKWRYPMDSRYNKGRVVGGLVQRSVSVAGITIPSQLVGVAWNITNMPLDGSVQGLLGLGLKAGTWYPDGMPKEYEYDPVFQNILDKGYKSFSIALRGVENPSGSVDPGILAFGGVPKSIVANSPWARAYLSTSDPHYLISIDSYVLVGGPSIQLTPAERTAVIDSGTTISFLPDKVAVAFFNSIPGTGKVTDICQKNADGTLNTGPNEKCIDKDSDLWKIPCSARAQAPPFSVVINGVEFKLRADTLIVQVGTNYCASGIQSSTGDFILGENFMKNVVVYHDYSNQQAPIMDIATYDYKP